MCTSENAGKEEQVLKINTMNISKIEAERKKNARSTIYAKN